MIKLSIITINYNNAQGLLKTMESVFAQSFSDYEYIIIDGGSTDGSKDLVKQYDDKLSYWVSEKDEGIYNAMNKGLRHVNGEYILFLNSGDAFAENFLLNNIVDNFGKADIIYGNIRIVEPSKQWIKYYNEKLSFEYFTRDTLPHQGSFIKRNLFDEIGVYDESLKIVADWKFFLEAVCIYSVFTFHIDQVIADYDYTGISARPEYYTLQAAEKSRVLKELFPLHVDSINELHELRQRKRFYDSFEKDFFVQKYFALKLKWKALKRRFTR